ncbi:hypothetical protein [Actinomadura hibisca]|uniref:hypothetical protein n=1 Tax=Actinomadura hibisca TaxID=68565 RepID=UPI0012F7114D|nr:hypothetical protein [Actinomadura hibisca]
MVVAVASQWFGLNWVDWLNVVAFPLGIIGLVLTWRQAKGAQDAAVAARSAMTRAQRQIRANQLMTLIPQLRWTTAELDLAIKSNDPDLAARQLEHWKWQVGYIRGVVIGIDANQTALLVKLQNSVTLASTATYSLVDTNREVHVVCLKARKAIGEACDALIPMLGEQSTQVNE